MGFHDLKCIQDEVGVALKTDSEAHEIQLFKMLFSCIE